jgi:hypothetical protein
MGLLQKIIRQNIQRKEGLQCVTQCLADGLARKLSNELTQETTNIIIGCLNEVIKSVKVSWLSKVRTELLTSFVLNIIYTLNCMLKYDFIDFII